MDLPGIVQVNTRIPSALDRFYARQQQRQEMAYRQHAMDIGDQQLAQQGQEIAQRGQQLQQKADEMKAAADAQRQQQAAQDFYAVLDSAVKPDGTVDMAMLSSQVPQMAKAHGVDEQYAAQLTADITSHPEMAKMYKEQAGIAAFGDKYLEMTKPKTTVLGENAKLVDDSTGATLATGNTKPNLVSANVDGHMVRTQDAPGLDVTPVPADSYVFAKAPGESEARRMTNAEAVRLKATQVAGKDSGDYSPPAPSTANDARQSLWQAAESGTGGGGAARRAFAVVGGQFGGEGDLAPQTNQSAGDLNAAMGDVIKAMAANPRYPVREMEMIRDRFPLEPSVMRPTPVMHTAMRSMNGQLVAQFNQRLAVASDDKADPKVREAASKQAITLHNFILRLGVPPASEPKAKFLRIAGDYSIWQRPNGKLFKYDGVDTANAD